MSHHDIKTKRQFAQIFAMVKISANCFLHTTNNPLCQANSGNLTEPVFDRLAHLYFFQQSSEKTPVFITGTIIFLE
ncbi:hypothetical protein SAMN04515647_3835 [Cohaesibacter sp. ES.047]|nr:hypothetical protein SAMN04515647_3835 [Cohaesibacter sp. ES.047]